MSNSLGALVVTLGLEASEYIKGLTKAEYEAKKSSERIKSQIAGVATALAGLGLGAIFVDAVKHAADFADEMETLATNVGVGVEAFSALAYAAKQSDTDSEKLAAGLREISKDAATGGEVISKFGVSLRNASGDMKSADQLFIELADRFESMPNGVNKTNAAIELFGSKVGPQLIPLLNQGSQGLRALTDEAERFGVVVSKESAESAKQFNDNLLKVQAAAQGIVKTAAKPLIALLADLSTEFLEASKNAGVAEAAFLSFGAAIKRVTGSDVIGKLESEARANANAIALTVKQLENYQALANRGVAGADTRVNELRAQYEKLSANATRISDQLKKEADDTYAKNTPKKSGKEEDGDVPNFTKKIDFAQKYLEQLEKQNIQAKNLSVEEEALAEIQSGRLGKLTPKQQESIINLAKEIDLTKEKRKVEEEEAKWLESVKAKTDIGRIDAQAKEVRRLNDAYEDGRLSYVEWQQALVNARKGTDESLELNRRLSAGLAQSFADGFADAILEAKSFSDVLSSVAVEVQRLIIKLLVIRPLQQSIEAGFNSAGGLAGLFGGASSSGTNYSITSGQNTGGLGLKSPSFAGGGYTGSGSRSGGIDGMGGFAAILHPNETVVDHAAGQGLGGGSNVQVNIINNSGSQVSQTRRDNADGSTTIDVMIQRIEEGIAGNVAAGTGALSGALGYRYGLQAT